MLNAKQLNALRRGGDFASSPESVGGDYALVLCKACILRDLRRPRGRRRPSGIECENWADVGCPWGQTGEAAGRALPRKTLRLRKAQSASPGSRGRPERPRILEKTPFLRLTHFYSTTASVLDGMLSPPTLTALTWYSSCGPRGWFFSEVSLLIAIPTCARTPLFFPMSLGCTSLSISG